MTMIITTKKGSKIELTLRESGSVDVAVIGTKYEFSRAKLITDRNLGLCVQAGTVTAPIADTDANAAREFFANAEKIHAEWLAQAATEFKNSSEGFSARMNARMYGRGSDH